MSTQLSKQLFAPIQPRFIELADEKTFKKEVSFAMQHIAKNAQLQKCEQASLISAVLNVAQFGLTLNPIQKQAYLVPRWDRNSNSMQAYLEPSYQGLITAVCKSPRVNNMIAEIVHENDTFKVTSGTNPQIIHEQARENRGNITHVYAVAFFQNRTFQFEVMTLEEIEEVRETSTSYAAYKAGKIKTCIWVDWFGEMAKKTTIRRLIKYLPHNSDENLRQLVSLDESDFMPEWNQVHYAEGLIKTSCYDDDTKFELESNLHSMNRAELETLVSDLQNNQLSPMDVRNGRPTPTEIAKDLKKRIS